MRIAFVADVHGNAFALQTALAEVAAARCDRIVFLGDAAATGPNPTRAIEMLARLDAISILGNTDAWVLDPSLAPTAPGTAVVREIAEWAHATLDTDHKTYLAALRPKEKVDLPGGRTLLAFHGSPRSYDDVVKDSTDESELAIYFEGVDDDFLTGGHTHRQMLRTYRDSVLLNPGSVGLPARSQESSPDTWSMNPWTQFAVLDADPGAWRLELRTVALDVGVMLSEAASSDMPHLGWWRRLWGR